MITIQHRFIQLNQCESVVENLIILTVIFLPIIMPSETNLLLTPLNQRGEIGGFTTLKVYDLLGREIATLVSKIKKADDYQFEFNADKYNLAAGVYFYKLQSGSFTSTKKFVLMK